MRGPKSGLLGAEEQRRSGCLRDVPASPNSTVFFFSLLLLFLGGGGVFPLAPTVSHIMMPIGKGN